MSDAAAPRPGAGLPDAVVFDFDGLVVDTEWTEFVTVSAVFAHHGAELSAGLWASFVGTTDHPHWLDLLEDQLGAPVDRDRWLARRSEAGLAAARELDPLPGVVELIDALGESGVPLGVASSSTLAWVEGLLVHLGLRDRFAAIATGDEVSRTKPDPALYRLACERLGVSPRRCVAVEDSVHGVVAARAAGLAAVAVPSRLTADHDHRAADLVVASCAALSPVGLGELVAGRP